MLLAHTQTPSTNSPKPSLWSQRYSLRTHTFVVGRLVIKQLILYLDPYTSYVPYYEKWRHTLFHPHRLDETFWEVQEYKKTYSDRFLLSQPLLILQ